MDDKASPAWGELKDHQESPFFLQRTFQTNSLHATAATAAATSFRGRIDRHGPRIDRRGHVASNLMAMASQRPVELKSGKAGKFLDGRCFLKQHVPFWALWESGSLPHKYCSYSMLHNYI